MSDMEFIRGKFITLGVSVKTFMKVEDEDEANELFWDTYKRSQYIVLNGIVHKTIEYEELDPCGHVHVEKNKDGTVDFVSLFYNGGGSLEETIEEGLRKC